MELMELSDTIRLCNLGLKSAETHLRNLQVEKFSGQFINARSPLKRETALGKGRNGREGKEWKRGIYMALQTPALFASTQEYSKHGRVGLNILFTRIRVRMRCCMRRKTLTRCRNSGCPNNDLLPLLIDQVY
jgi:hypothetical protein